MFITRIPVKVVNMLTKKPPLKQKNNDYPNKNGRICHIKYRTEEQKIIIAHNRNPRRPGVVKKREEKHIDNLTMEPRGWRIGGMILKKYSVECTIDNISDCTTEDQGHAPEKSG